MEKRLNYILVGVFVITLTIGLFTFLFWLAKYGDKSVKHDYYKTSFQESVSGLNVESLVKLNGVEIGRVKDISISKENSEDVDVVLAIKEGTPIKVDTIASLGSIGITGLKYIELSGGSNESKMLATTKENIANIRSKKSAISAIVDGGESITVKLENSLDKVSQLLSEKNIDNISHTLNDLSQTMSYINANKERLEKLYVQIYDFLEHTKKFESSIEPSINKLGVMSDKAGAAADGVKTLVDAMKQELDNGQYSMGEIVEENLEVLNETAHSLNKLSLKLEKSIEELKESPSDLLYKSKKDILGPGESHD
jgi:phospholipid/cholesterol/gamma-HCH transport system substrate-binding protein